MPSLHGHTHPGTSLLPQNGPSRHFRTDFADHLLVWMGYLSFGTGVCPQKKKKTHSGPADFFFFLAVVARLSLPSQNGNSALVHAPLPPITASSIAPHSCGLKYSCPWLVSSPDGLPVSVFPSPPLRRLPSLHETPVPRVLSLIYPPHPPYAHPQVLPKVSLDSSPLPR